MPTVNQKVGPYTLIKKLGQGGFGEVWLAEKRSQFISKKVAVKLPLKENVDVDAVRHEATLWEQASGHANVLPIIDADEFDGQIAIVSEYAPDGSLADLLKKQGFLSVEKSVEMIDGVLAGLEFLHSRKIIHRDLKPDNVLLQGETPRLADFGISRILRTTMTSSSVNLAGTPFYMAPECFDKKRNEQTDIWAVGVMLYEVLAGKRPFEDDNLINLVSSIATAEPQPLPANVPNWLNDVVRKALAKVPENRYKTASEMRSHIRQLAKMPDTQQVIVFPNPKDEVKTQTDNDNFYISTPTTEKPNNFWKLGTVALSAILLSGIGGAIYLNQPTGTTAQNTNQNSQTEITQTTNNVKNVENKQKENANLENLNQKLKNISTNSNQLSNTNSDSNKLTNSQVINTNLLEEIKQTALNGVKKELVDSSIKLKEIQTLKVDFDGDGNQDYAVLLFAEKEKHLFTVFIFHPFSKSSEVFFEEFGIGNSQKGICKLEKDPLTVEELDVETINEYWNVKISPKTKAQGLNLDGGGCDGVHLFWILKTKQVGWWRL
jgi:serine/threonine protein kinase